MADEATAKLAEHRFYENDTLLPKYSISAGRDGSTSVHLSMARIYIRNLEEATDAITGSPLVDNRLEEPGTYIGFLLQSVTEQRAEKVQTTSLQGDSSHTTFFGESPRQYSFNGILFNSPTARWRESWTLLYDNYLRGYKAASNGRPVQIVYDDKIVSGWVTSLTQQLSAINEMMVSFSMTVQVIKETLLTPVGTIADNFSNYTMVQDIVGGVSSIDNQLPVDDYVRKASIALPRRAVRGTGVGTVGKYRILDPTLVRNNEDSDNPGAPVASTSPTSSGVDLSEAIVYHKRQLDSAIGELEATKGSSKSATRKRQAAIRRKQAAERSLSRAQGWVEGGTDITSQKQGTEAQTALKQYSDWESKNSSKTSTSHGSGSTSSSSTLAAAQSTTREAK